jgi:hypothetical protein
MSSVNENGLKKLRDPMSSVKKEDVLDEDLENLQFDEDIHPESIARQQSVNFKKSQHNTGRLHSGDKLDINSSQYGSRGPNMNSNQF